MSLNNSPPQFPLVFKIDSFNVSALETKVIREALRYNPNASKEELAILLGISQRTLYRKLIDLGEMEPGTPKPRVKKQPTQRARNSNKLPTGTPTASPRHLSRDRNPSHETNKRTHDSKQRKSKRKSKK